MKAQDIELKQNHFLFNTSTLPARSHYKFFMRTGQLLPATKAQAKYFISAGCCLNILTMDDVINLEDIYNKYGFQGDYRYTKSKRWVRLNNQLDLHEAIAKKFSL